jgi:DNA-binding beta-propeller fold protein YncE
MGQGGGAAALAAVVALGLTAGAAHAALQAGEPTPTGQAITPSAAPGSIFQTLNPGLADLPDYTAGQASAVALSPDGRTLLILTSGFNRMSGPEGKSVASQSNEYVFVYDVSGARPEKRQVLAIKNTFIGIAWAPAGDRFYVAGGVDDDVMEFAAGSGGFAAARTFPLGHKAGLGLEVKPEAGGLAVSPDGRRLLVANVQNDSVSLIELESGRVSELDLRPGAHDAKPKGKPGGTYPRAVAWVSDRKAYVASERDREVIALSLGAKGLAAGARIPMRGQPVALLANAKAGRLYAALDNTDGVAVIDPRSDKLVERVATAAPRALLARTGPLTGAGSNSLALSPDGRTLLVTNGGENAVAVVRLGDRAAGLAAAKAKPRARHDDDDDAPKAGTGSEVVGLIPTGWYPTGVAMSADGRHIYAVNGKSNAGPNPKACRNNLSIAKDAKAACTAQNQYVWQLEKAGFLTLPTPSPAELGELTRQTAANNHFPGAGAARQGEATMAFLRQHIHHVIYIVKENRTYDQVLGDLEVGNGDPKLAVFGRAITPNLHAMAREFVDLDNFLDSGESSNTGWNWSTAARTNDWTEREAPVNYGGRGLQYDQEGDNRNLNVGFATSAERRKANPLGPPDPNMLPGARDVAAPDAPEAAERGYIWDSALRAGLTVRNWGFYGDLVLYDKDAGKYQTPKIREPWKTRTPVFVVAKASLRPFTDPYFRGFDQAFPDYWRFKEWEREFDGFVASGKVPNLMLVRLPHDHTGDFADGIDGINTVEAELADNDYAVGLLVEKVAKSPFAKDTLIFVVEDDAQDGPDHVDAHRAPAYVVGPYVRKHAVISTRHTTVNLVRTMEDVLGIKPLGLTDGLADPMADVFDVHASGAWSFTAHPSAILRSTKLPLPAERADAACVLQPKRSAAYWAAAMAGQDFRHEDRLNTAAYNLALWRGLKGREPYPAVRTGADLRVGRDKLLAASTGSEGCGA